MRILIIGAEQLGYFLSKSLMGSGHKVTIIDSDPVRCEQIANTFDVTTFCGDGTRVETLAAAGAGKTSLARLIARMHLCESAQPPCGRCRACVQVAALVTIPASLLWARALMVSVLTAAPHLLHLYVFTPGAAQVAALVTVPASRLWPRALT